MKAPATLRPPSMPAKHAGARWSPPPIVITSDAHQRDGGGWTTPRRTKVLVISSESDGREAVDLSGDGLEVLGSPNWAPDSREVLFAARPAGSKAASMSSAIYRVTTAGEGAQRITPLVDRSNDLAPIISGDGRRIAYLHYDASKVIWQQKVRILDLRKGTVSEPFGRLDRSVNQLLWGPGDRLWVAYEDAGALSVAVTDLINHAQKPPDVLVRDGDDNQGVSISHTGRLAYLRETPQSVSQVAILEGVQARTLTRLNESLFSQRTLATVAPFETASSFDGRTVHGYIMTPPGYVAGRRYPTIVYLHGGPYGFEGPGWHAELQLFAAAGYVVLYPNPRGSTSYGWHYTIALPSSAVGHDYDDIMSTVDAAVSRGFTDPQRLFVTGVSYGGEMTAWIVGKTDRFRAAVAEKPVINAISNELQGDQYLGALLDNRGLPWEHPDVWWKTSPLSLVGAVTTPTLLMVGDEDRRTPPEEARQFYNALQLRSVPSALIVYPGASHESLGAPRSQLLSTTAYTLTWFQQHGGVAAQ